MPLVVDVFLKSKYDPIGKPTINLRLILADLNGIPRFIALIGTTQSRSLLPVLGVTTVGLLGE
jgi:hypothetical protein